MDKITLKELAPYLPYGLKWVLIEEYPDGTEITTHLMGSLSIDFEGHEEWWNIEGDNYLLTDDYKPILRPLSEYKKFEDIMDEFSEYSESVFQQNFFGVFSDINLSKFDHINYTIMTLFFKHHFDVFGLIDKGLAIDINTLHHED